MSAPGAPLYGPKIEEALRACARWHHGQSRKGDPGLPYVSHVVAVAWILDRAGFGEEVVIAGLLHDVVEDRDIPMATIAEEFGPVVAELVAGCTERKRDDQGRDRPWRVRKDEAIASYARASVEGRAIALADKLHNLCAIAHDLDRGRDVWSIFRADREQVLWYYRAAIEACGGDDPRLERLAEECRRWLDRLASAPG